MILTDENDRRLVIVIYKFSFNRLLIISLEKYLQAGAIPDKFLSGKDISDNKICDTIHSAHSSEVNT